MRAFIVVVFTAAGISLLFGANSLAETAGEKCDSVASHPFDKSNPANVKPVKIDDIDAEKAIEYCSAAVAAEPDSTRYHFQLGRALNRAKKFELALAEYKIAADKGHWLATANIGDIYFYGDLGAPDYEKAFPFNIAAAEHGIDYAALSVAMSYRDGLGVAKDPVKALAWFRRTYELSEDPVAALDIGYAYETGAAVAVDHAEALRWYRISADKGNAMAMNNIGVMYDKGLAVAQDRVKALVWFRKAEANGNPLAHINIGEFFDNGRAGEVDHGKAADYVLKAFEIGNNWDDRTNRDLLFGQKWTPDFWREFQTRLKARNLYQGPIDGTPSEATKGALEKVVDK
jgi:TPR repeat protein